MAHIVPHPLALFGGLALAIVILIDAFEAIILPRRVTRRIRVTRLFYRTTWAFWKAVVRKILHAVNMNQLPEISWTEFPVNGDAGALNSAGQLKRLFERLHRLLVMKHRSLPTLTGCRCKRPYLQLPQMSRTASRGSSDVLSRKNTPRIRSQIALSAPPT